MKKTILFSLVLITGMAFRPDNEVFIGQIIYKNTFTDLKGKDVTDRVAVALGREQHYFTDGSNYKTTDEKSNLTQLYTADNNACYSVSKDGSAQKYDAAQQTSAKYTVMHLDKTEKIAGYECQSVKIETEGLSTIYYYSPMVRVNAEVFKKHNFGGWNRYMQETNGALPLKFVLTNYKMNYVWTATAREVTRAALTPKDFILPAGVRIEH